MPKLSKKWMLFGCFAFVSIFVGGGVHKALADNVPLASNSSYTVSIPSSLTINNKSSSINIAGSLKEQTKLDISISSKTGFQLKNRNEAINYSLSKTELSIDNIFSANVKSFDENINITKASSGKTSGNYTDILTFDISATPYTFELDMNTILDGVAHYATQNYGTADIYINGALVSENDSNFDRCLPYGTAYEFKNIKGTEGHHYEGPESVKGIVGQGWNLWDVRQDNPTNSGAIDVSNADIAFSESGKYDDFYDAQSGLFDVSRLKKTGYTAKKDIWTIGKGGKEINDNVGFAKTQGIAEYLGVLEQFKTQDVTVDLYPVWSANVLIINYHTDGATEWVSSNGDYSTSGTVEDVTGKDIAFSEIVKYDDPYDEQWGLFNVNRLHKSGYKAKSGVWTIGKDGKEISDDVGFAKVQGIAEYLGVLNQLENGDATVDLYPVWIKI